MRQQSKEWGSDFDYTEAVFTISHDAPPNAPSKVTAKSRFHCTRDVISITWKDNSTNETGFEIRNNTVSTIVRVGPNVTRAAWSMSTLDMNVPQCFNVRAVGKVGASDWRPGLIVNVVTPVCV
ncbi:hypothetical protein [Streptomyces sp. NPDC051098]|uniref:hypothetical protein n=1 Tax=Streptomyces sp. NPDC051098 TaxID=3155411 RepID=UPI00342B9A56